MSVFNRIFRTKAHISNVGICRYKPRSGVVPERGVEIQLRHVIRGRNFTIILPFSVMRELPQFWDESNRFSTDLMSGCNILLEIQKTTSYRQKKDQVEKKKKELELAGISTEKQRIGEAQLARAQKVLGERIRQQQKLREELSRKQKQMRKKGVL